MPIVWISLNSLRSSIIMSLYSLTWWWCQIAGWAYLSLVLITITRVNNTMSSLGSWLVYFNVDCEEVHKRIKYYLEILGLDQHTEYLTKMAVAGTFSCVIFPLTQPQVANQQKKKNKKKKKIKPHNCSCYQE